MTSSECSKIRNEYENLKTLKQEFDLALETAISKTQSPEEAQIALEKAKELKVELEEKKEMLIEKVDPYLINLRDKLAKTIGAQFIDKFSPEEGLARVQKDNKWYFIDKTGKMIGETFDWVYNFNEGLAWVRKNNEEFYIDKKGRRLFS